MHTQTLWGNERRAARAHWWRQVLDRPVTTGNWGEVLDEVAKLRFGLGEDREGAPAAVDGWVAAMNF